MPDNARVYPFTERSRLRVVGIGSAGEITLARSFLWGKSFGFKVAMNAARPCSAQAQNGLSSGGRRVACYADLNELRLLSKEIDHLADKVAPNTESR